MRKFDPLLLSAGIALVFGRSVAAAVIASSIWLANGVAVAQTVPSPSATDPANEIRRQQDRDRAVRERAEPRVDIRSDAVSPIAPVLLPEGETPCFDITKVELRGDRAQRFQWVLAACRTYPTEIM